jgi:penicillin G amidase
VNDFVEQLRAQAAAAAFPVDGELTVAGLEAPARIRRDRWGVPYVQAASLEDLWFAQGIVTAGERLFQVDLAIRAAGGRLSEVFGERTFADDRFARTVGFHRAGRAYLKDWSETDRAMHARFREGVAAWIRSMPVPPIEYQLLDVTPDLPEDAAAWAACFAQLAWGLSNNWDKELLRAAIADRAGFDAVGVLMPSDAGGNGKGSNDWAVAGKRTSTGGPLLANDPHLLALQPGPWLEIHLDAPGYRVRGVALPFGPGVILGATEHHAWGVTNVTGDVQDLYLERLNEEGTAALHGETWEPLTVHREEIAVRGEPRPRVVDVRQTRHGPILEHRVDGILHAVYRDLAQPYALRWTGADRSLRPSLTLEVAGADSFSAFREAVLQIACPGQNFVYADVGGTIGYQCTGLHPIRRAGDGTAPVPGWDDDHEWDGFIPLQDLPWAADPPRGFVATANNRIHDDDYPYLISADVYETGRLRRIEELLGRRDDHDVASMTAIQTDTVSLAARETLPLLLRLDPVTEDRRAALAELAGWDGDMRADSAGAAIFNVWCAEIARRVLEPILGDELFAAYHARREPFQCRALPGLLRDPRGWLDDDLLRSALDDALAWLRERLGHDRSTWSWGAVHVLVLAHPLATIPGLEALFVAVRAPLGGDEQTVAQGGFDGLEGFRPAVIASWRVVWDLADLDRSVGVVPAGVSGNPGSPHWNDQAALFTTGRVKELPFSEAAVDRASVASLSLRPG